MHDHREHRPHFFSSNDHAMIFELLFDADQIVGQYHIHGHTENNVTTTTAKGLAVTYMHQIKRTKKKRGNETD
jgi:hypothetical protein